MTAVRRAVARNGKTRGLVPVSRGPVSGRASVVRLGTKGETEEMTERVRAFIDGNPDLEAPFLVVDLDKVEALYHALAKGMPYADIYYAVKANPAPQILKRVAKLGASFDCASPREIRDALEAGATPDRISYGSTIKKEHEIRTAFELGVNLFCYDCEEELEKIARQAPGSRVFCRILVDNTGADWPLTRKFGCEPAEAVPLLELAAKRGLVPYGLSFHVGSQQLQPLSFPKAIAEAADVVVAARKRGLRLEMLNLGGGLPAHYDRKVPDLVNYTAAIKAGLDEANLGDQLKQVIIEPGRYLVGDAGVTVSEVILTAQRGEHRWVYLDVGKFGGLAETIDEAIRYRVKTTYNGAKTAPTVLAGPTCDSADVLYEKNVYQLPQALKAGDRVQLLSTGAYTTTYASTGFNGIPPLSEYYI
jgi:ornithine decarboxylase